jgi:peptidyl-prolyl cis-trans isomerase B (cyclophilin B)
LPAVVRPAALLFACLCLLAAGCGGGAKNDKPSSSGAESTPAPAKNANGCEQASQPQPKDVGSIKKPTEKLDPAKTYVATVSTSCGDFQITLDAKRAPKTGGSFKYLADKGFFDNTKFHRVEGDFVIQGGDPNGDGTGGPGYSVVEAPPSDLTYSRGVVAMAKTQIEAPGTSGSQFFVVTAEDTPLPPEYALLGKVTKGQETVDKIAAVPVNGSTPIDPVVIRQIKVTES